MRIFSTIVFAIIVSFSVTPSFVFAADAGTVTNPFGGVGNAGRVAPSSNNSGTDIKLINPLKAGTSLDSFLNDILAFVIRIGTIVVILMVVFVGYKFVVAQGKPGEIEEAKKMLLWTVVGALILLGSQAIAISLKATVTAITGS